MKKRKEKEKETKKRYYMSIIRYYNCSYKLLFSTYVSSLLFFYTGLNDISSYLLSISFHFPLFMHHFLFLSHSIPSFISTHFLSPCLFLHSLSFNTRICRHTCLFDTHMQYVVLASSTFLCFLKDPFQVCYNARICSFYDFQACC